MGLDILRLGRPAPIIQPVRFGSAVFGQGVEAGFDDGQPRAARYRLKPEFDQRRRLLGVVDARIDGVGMPIEREQACLARLRDSCNRKVALLGRKILEPMKPAIRSRGRARLDAAEESDGLH
jgi:hypothetical protein